MFLRIGSSDLYSKQMPQCIDGTMDLAPFLAFLAVITGTRSAFAARLLCAYIENDTARLACFALRDAQDRPSILADGFKNIRHGPSAAFADRAPPKAENHWDAIATALWRGQFNARR